MNQYPHPYRQIISWIDDLDINQELREELIDHYCTQFDNSITSEKEENVLTQIKQRIDEQTFHSKSNYMTHLFFTSLLIFMSYFSFHQQEVHKVELPTSDFCIQVEPPYGNPLGTFALDISSGFGQRKHPITKQFKLHRGVDLKAPLGTPVVAVADGKVISCGYDKKKGYHIEIQHEDNYTTRYYHMKQYNVKEGEEIRKGDIIGEVGNSGMSMASHLHYEILKDEKNIDPYDYLGA